MYEDSPRLHMLIIEAVYLIVHPLRINQHVYGNNQCAKWTALLLTNRPDYALSDIFANFAPRAPNTTNHSDSFVRRILFHVLICVLSRVRR